MKTIIIYTSADSCTREAVYELSQKLSGEVETTDLRFHNAPSVDKFDRIIIGGSIHSEKIQKRINDFCLTHIHVLRIKEIGLFICCPHDPETAQESINKAFPEELHQMAKTEAVFSRTLNLDEMSFVKRLLVRMRESESKLDEDTINRFANRMERTYHPFLLLV